MAGAAAESIGKLKVGPLLILKATRVQAVRDSNHTRTTGRTRLFPGLLIGMEPGPACPTSYSAPGLRHARTWYGTTRGKRQDTKLPMGHAGPWYVSRGDRGGDLPRVKPSAGPALPRHK